MASVAGESVIGSNRKGLTVSMPQEVSDALSQLDDCVLDGELLGDGYVVFDLLKTAGSDLREQPYRERYSLLTHVLGSVNSGLLRTARTAWDTHAKHAFYSKIAASNGEGVVFKKVDAPSIAGRPASGGAQVKCKFYATGTFVVLSRNDQRSVQVGLHDAAAKLVSVGNVTIPPHKDIPEVSALVEIRYLYAYKGGSLYQPHYLGPRDDIDLRDCVLDQLKYKPAGCTAEAE